MTKDVDYLLIGGGLASAFAADTLRKEGATGTIVIISEEPFLPYYRPQLPRAFLLGTRKKEQLFIFNEAFYKKNDIELCLAIKALSLDGNQKTVLTDKMGIVHFKQLLMATGCSSRKMDIPGCTLAGIHYLKTIIDAQPIIPAIEKAKHVVIYGGSFIGIEVASLLIKKNIKVTVITDEFVLFNVSPSAEIGIFLENHGVDVILGDTLKKFNGTKYVTSVETSKGKKIDCDFVIITENHIPETAFLLDSGIHVDDGIIVDQYLQTNKKDIFAAGDVAKFYDPVFRRLHRNGGTDNAMKQGKIAAFNMLGMRRCYNTASYFYFQAFDNSIVIIGDTFDANEKLIRGSVLEKNSAFLYIKDGFLQGAFFSGRPIEEIKAAESLILNRVNVTAHQKKMLSLDFSLEGIATQTVLALQGGGALGAFECGVVKAMEEQGIYPDIVSGISIGAFNSAIIAANPKHATEALEGFWNDLSLDLFDNSNEQIRRLLSSWHSIVWGSPNFFYPRWGMSDQLPFNWTSFYDNSSIKNLLCKYIDFEQLKNSPIRLLVMAVNVETAEFETFDSYSQEIIPEHVIASGSLPPGFPWTTINNKHYWDGGIVSNTPIDSTLDICGAANKNIYVVELYSRKRDLPKNMIEVLARKDEIFFSEKIRKDIQTRDLISSYKKLIEGILNFCEPALVEEVRQLPIYIQTMGESGVLPITRIIREMGKDEPYSWDSDFSRETIIQHQMHGYEATKKILKSKKAKKES
ncbi:MAG: FAD-dependent oxidoreductase [bacterium]|nr:FAD-dependent oxidoreductase [bacterium]